MTAQKALGYAGVVLAGLVLPYIFPGYQIQMTELWLFVVFALSWDLVGGQMGYNSFGNVVFLGVGMYGCAVVQIGLFYDVGMYTAARGGGENFVFDSEMFLQGLMLGLPLGALIAGVTGALLGSLILGMRGHYFAICTLGLGIAAGEIAAGWEWLGAGSGMTTPEISDDQLDAGWLLYHLAFGLAVLVFVFLRWLYGTRFGLMANAIRDDEDKAESLGLHTKQTKIMGWTLAALFLGLAGGILGNLKKFIDPVDVAFSGATYGVWMVLMAILGGKGTLWGPVLGALIFQITKELFWTYLLGWQRVALGVLIIVIVVFFPRGLMGWVQQNRVRQGSL